MSQRWGRAARGKARRNKNTEGKAELVAERQPGMLHMLGSTTWSSCRQVSFIRCGACVACGGRWGRQAKRGGGGWCVCSKAKRGGSCKMYACKRHVKAEVCKMVCGEEGKKAKVENKGKAGEYICHRASCKKCLFITVSLRI